VDGRELAIRLRAVVKSNIGPKSERLVQFKIAPLRKRTRKMFLFRDEYIFELVRAIVVEVPQQGHATYVFSRPGNLDQWVRDYARTLKDDLRKNRANVAKRLGFLGRVMHGRNPKTWLRDLRAKVGEAVDYSLSVEAP